MKLRNKKTGEIKEVEKLWIYGICPSMFGDRSEYRSLASLNEEWEDYKPKEPLIKLPKIRNIINEISGLFGIRTVRVTYDYDGNTIIDFPERARLKFMGMVVESDQDACTTRDYGVIELCGEEE